MGRVKAFAEYIRELERLATDPVGTLVAVDITGSPTQFSNWISNDLYGGVLQAYGRYVSAYRRANGLVGTAAQRNFVIDPKDLSVELITNLEATLWRHLHEGVIAGIIYQDAAVPNEVIADIANLADRICIDYGRLEAYGGKAPSLLEITAPVGDPQFRRIRERVAWTMDPKNLDLLVRVPGDVSALVADLRAKLNAKMNDSK
jgi:hypothetical protein